MKGELHLFIIWDRARVYEKEILEDLRENFRILQILEITWPKESFDHNLSAFYGKKLPPGCEKEKEVGTGPFLLVLIEDPEPFHVVRRTNQGEALVNVNIFDSKEMYRKWLRSHNIHSSNSPEEVDHDLYLLLGLHREEAERILSEGGEIKAYRKVL